MASYKPLQHSRPKRKADEDTTSLREWVRQSSRKQRGVKKYQLALEVFLAWMGGWMDGGHAGNIRSGRLRSKYRPKMHVWLCKSVGLTAYGVLTQRTHPGESREAGRQGVCISA